MRGRRLRGKLEEQGRMQRWIPNREWEGEDVYCIGGGDSLRPYHARPKPFEFLRGRRTVGCNVAFILGRDLCNVLVFGDSTWWEGIGSKRLHSYEGEVICCAPALKDDPTPFLHYAPRYELPGFSAEPGKLSFNGNTGSLAINAALQLGARRVFLLGYDMDAPNGIVNWHDVRTSVLRNPSTQLAGFANQIRGAAADVAAKFPGAEVWNVTDASKLTCFPRVSLRDHFGDALDIGKGEIK